MAQVHDARGWWLREAGAESLVPAPPLRGSARADLVVVGGGYAGLWTAWEARAHGLSVVLLEAERCGHGPSGRNGGFVDALWHAAPRLRERYGDRAARALGQASGESVRAIGAWCAAEGVDACYRRAGQLVASAAPAQDGVGADVARACAELGAGEQAIVLSATEVRARCASPVLRGAVLLPTTATVQPARLVLGLRARVLAAGVRVHEHTRALGLHERPGGVEVATEGGVVRADAAVLAAGCALGALRPLRDRLTVASSHLVMTEPVGDVLAEVGWTGGECITDGRALVHYFRTTADGRIAFGWGGGLIGAGARTGGRAEIDPGVVASIERDLLRFFPALAGRRVVHAWGGPIDAAPDHLPAIVSLPGGRAWAVVGFTGNGVGPAHLAGRVLARLVRDVRDDLTALPIVDPPPRRLPPEPLRALGGNAIRAALDRAERAEERGGRASAPVRWAAELPARMGVHIGR